MSDNFIDRLRKLTPQELSDFFALMRQTEEERRSRREAFRAEIGALEAKIQLFQTTSPKISFCHPVAGRDGIVPLSRSEFGRGLVSKFYPGH